VSLDGDLGRQVLEPATPAVDPGNEEARPITPQTPQLQARPPLLPNHLPKSLKNAPIKLRSTSGFAATTPAGTYFCGKEAPKRYWPNRWRWRYAGIGDVPGAVLSNGGGGIAGPVTAYLVIARFARLNARREMEDHGQVGGPVHVLGIEPVGENTALASVSDGCHPCKAMVI